jgi:hypothetical protein
VSWPGKSGSCFSSPFPGPVSRVYYYSNGFNKNNIQKFNLLLVMFIFRNLYGQIELLKFAQVLTIIILNIRKKQKKQLILT